MEVRKATHEDVPAIMDLGEEMCDESPVFSRYTQDFAKQYRVLSAIIDSPTAAIFVTGDLKGMLIVHLEQMPWFTNVVAVEDVMFVSRPVRKSRRAASLIEAFLQWAEEKGAFEIHMGISTEVDVERTEKFYGKFGILRTGVTFRKEI